jgi:hypothetical protein
VIDIMKEEYKINREILDDLMIEYDIPKIHRHNSNWLNLNIDKYIPIDSNDFQKFIRSLHKIFPSLTRLWSVDYNDIEN